VGYSLSGDGDVGPNPAAAAAVGFSRVGEGVGAAAEVSTRKQSAMRPTAVDCTRSFTCIAVGASSLLNSGSPCSLSAEQGRPEYFFIKTFEKQFFKSYATVPFKETIL
jgi:hypothetical protein